MNNFSFILIVVSTFALNTSARILSNKEITGTSIDNDNHDIGNDSLKSVDTLKYISKENESKKINDSLKSVDTLKYISEENESKKINDSLHNEDDTINYRNEERNDSLIHEDTHEQKNLGRNVNRILDVDEDENATVDKNNKTSNNSQKSVKAMTIFTGFIIAAIAL